MTIDAKPLPLSAQALDDNLRLGMSYSPIVRKEALDRIRQHITQQAEQIAALTASRDDWHKVADDRSGEINRLRGDPLTISDQPYCENCKR